MPEITALFIVERAGQMHNQTDEFVYLGGKVNHNADLSIEVDRRIRNAWCSFWNYTLGLYDRTSASLELNIQILRAEVLEQRGTATSRRSRACAATTRCGEPTTAF